MSVFFQFSGKCPDGSPQHTADGTDVRELFSGGCACVGISKEGGSTMTAGGYMYHHNRHTAPHNDWCKGRCTGNASMCSGVATINSYNNMKEAQQLARDIDGTVVGWDRSNTVQHALSWLKSRCEWGHGNFTAPENHVHGHGVTDEAPLALLHVDPGVLLDRVRQQTGRRAGWLAAFERMDAQKLGRKPVMTIYEKFQQNPEGETTALLRSVGILHPGTSTNEQFEHPIKVTPQFLGDLIVNFDEINASFARHAPCLIDQLVASTPTYFPETCSITSHSVNAAVQDAEKRRPAFIIPHVGIDTRGEPSLHNVQISMPRSFQESTGRLLKSVDSLTHLTLDCSSKQCVHPTNCAFGATEKAICDAGHLPRLTTKDDE